MAKSGTIQPLVRAYATNFTIRFNMIAATGTLYPVKKAEKDVKASFVSPEQNPVSRVWKDDVTGTIYEEGELARAIAVSDGTEKVIDKDALKNLRQSPLVKNLMDVSIHPTAEVETATFPSDHSAYLFTPDPASAKVVGFMTRTLADHDDLAVMGVCNIRNYEGLYRIVVWRNQLVLQRYLFATDVAPHPVAELAPESKETALFRSVMEKLVEPFNAEDYKNTRVERIRDAVAVLEATGAITVTAKPVEAEEDVVAALEGLLASLDPAS